MRALPLTNKARPGGRPRKSRAPRNSFADWLAKCGKKPADISKALGVSVSSIYNMRNGYFVPGRDMAIKIEGFTRGAVKVESWSDVKARPRKAA
jgi:hypothetical protein